VRGMTDQDWWRLGFPALLFLLACWLGQELWKISRALTSIAKSLRKISKGRKEKRL